LPAASLTLPLVSSYGTLSLLVRGLRSYPGQPPPKHLFGRGVDNEQPFPPETTSPRRWERGRPHPSACIPPERKPHKQGLVARNDALVDGPSQAVDLFSEALDFQREIGVLLQQLLVSVREFLGMGGTGDLL